MSSVFFYYTRGHSPYKCNLSTVSAFVKFFFSVAFEYNRAYNDRKQGRKTMKVTVKCYQGCGAELEVEIVEEGYITVEGGKPIIQQFTDGTCTVDIFCDACAKDR